MLRPAQLALISEIEIPWIDVVLGAAVLSYNEARLADNPSHATSWAQSGRSSLPTAIELAVLGYNIARLAGNPSHATSCAQSDSSSLPKATELDVFKGLKHVLISGGPERNSRWGFRKVERAVRCRAGKDDVEVECRVERSAFNELTRLIEQRAQSSA
jgi:hypothetical protein